MVVTTASRSTYSTRRMNNRSRPSSASSSSHNPSSHHRAGTTSTLTFLAGLLFGYVLSKNVGAVYNNCLCPTCPELPTKQEFMQQQQPVITKTDESILSIQRRTTKTANSSSGVGAAGAAGPTTTTTTTKEACQEQQPSSPIKQQQQEQLLNFPPKSLQNMFVDYGTVNRDAFLEHIDIGFPNEVIRSRNEPQDVMLLYNNQESLPSAHTQKNQKLDMSPTTALENCQILKVILQEPFEKKMDHTCFAIVPQWESYYVYKYMKVNTTLVNLNAGGNLDDKHPLEFVGRSHAPHNRAQKPPDDQQQMKSLDTLSEYIQALPKAQSELKSMFEKAGVDVNDKSKPLIVLVCNKGQSELFMNFICSVKARSLDISRIVLFATDQYTLELCQHMGLQLCYYNKQIFGQIPEEEAGRIGDGVFRKIMMGKVYSVHLVLTMGYSVLFQDVDVVWYQNPLSYFESSSNPSISKWDLLFQDDGSRSDRFAPFSANSGFYFVRNNLKTLYLFRRLLTMGDFISVTGSHQEALTMAMNEVVSVYGLKVKTWQNGENNAFPGGYEYHNNHDHMRALLKDETKIKPYIFHMSWTHNKGFKLKYFQQLGEWRVQEDCATSSKSDCCLMEPKVTCHYRDKPSSIPCHDSPPADERRPRPSFWDARR